MIFENRLSADVWITPDVIGITAFLLKPGESFEGSSYFLGDTNVVWSTLGATYRGTYNSIQLRAPVKGDAIVARSADAAAFPGVTITAGNSYTAWGRITWRDSGTLYEADFTITGIGAHGGPATFTVEDAAAATNKPQAISSSVSVSGVLAFAWTGAPDGNVASVEIVFDYDVKTRGSNIPPVPRIAQDGKARELPLFPTRALAVTPSDATVYDPPVRLYVGGTGNLVIVCADDAVPVTMAGVPATTFLDVMVKQVRAATTATNLVGFYV